MGQTLLPRSRHRSYPSLFVEGAVLACASLGIVEVLANLVRKRKARQISETQFRDSKCYGFLWLWFVTPCHLAVLVFAIPLF